MTFDDFKFGLRGVGIALVTTAAASVVAGVAVACAMSVLFAPLAVLLASQIPPIIQSGYELATERPSKNVNYPEANQTQAEAAAKRAAEAKPIAPPPPPPPAPKVQAPAPKVVAPPPIPKAAAPKVVAPPPIPKAAAPKVTAPAKPSVMTYANFKKGMVNVGKGILVVGAVVAAFGAAIFTSGAGGGTVGLTSSGSTGYKPIVPNDTGPAKPDKAVTNAVVKTGGFFSSMLETITPSFLKKNKNQAPAEPAPFVPTATVAVAKEAKLGVSERMPPLIAENNLKKLTSAMNPAVWQVDKTPRHDTQNIPTTYINFQNKEKPSENIRAYNDKLTTNSNSVETFATMFEALKSTNPGNDKFAIKVKTEEAKQNMAKAYEQVFNKPMDPKMITVGASQPKSEKAAEAIAKHKQGKEGPGPDVENASSHRMK